MSEYVYNLIREVKERMKAEGATTEAAFLQFIDDIIDEWLQYGKIHEDSDTELIKDQARKMWESVRIEIQGQENGISEEF